MSKNSDKPLIHSGKLMQIVGPEQLKARAPYVDSLSTSWDVQTRRSCCGVHGLILRFKGWADYNIITKAIQLQYATFHATTLKLKSPFKISRNVK